MEHFSWFGLLPGFGHDVGPFFAENVGEAHHHAVQLLPATWMVFFILTAIALVARRGLRKAQAQGGTKQYIPADNFGARNLMEIFIDGLLGQFESVLGSRKLAKTYLPLMGTLFFFILLCNLLGLIPGFLPPTSDTSTNWGMAAVVFFVFNIAGLRANGFGYIKHLAGPKLGYSMFVITMLIFVLETVGLFVRPFSLQLRLLANMSGDHLVFGIFSDLVPLFVPVIFLGLALFVSFVQAFVFTLLSVVYVGLAVAPHEGEH
jgi:F-type H+-transporting ATPase subunit a